MKVIAVLCFNTKSFKKFKYKEIRHMEMLGYEMESHSYHLPAFVMTKPNGEPIQYRLVTSCMDTCSWTYDAFLHVDDLSHDKDLTRIIKERMANITASLTNDLSDLVSEQEK